MLNWRLSFFSFQAVSLVGVFLKKEVKNELFSVNTFIRQYLIK